MLKVFIWYFHINVISYLSSLSEIITRFEVTEATIKIVFSLIKKRVYSKVHH